MRTLSPPSPTVKPVQDGKSWEVSRGTNEGLKTGSTKILFWTIPKMTFIYINHIIEMSEENN